MAATALAKPWICMYGGSGVFVESAPARVSSPEQQEKADNDEADGREHHRDHRQGRGSVVALLGLLQRQRDELAPLARISRIAPAHKTTRAVNDGAEESPDDS